MAILTVFLDKVTHLADGDGIGKSDPYVKFYLEQDNMIRDKDLGSHKSSKKKDEMNPVYGETFTFEIPDTMGLNNVVLHCKVMDDDPLKDDKLGSCKIKLDELSLTATPLGVDRVIDRNIIANNGRIYLKISYEA